MTERILMKGNEAIGEAAIMAGCRFYFGYPITPQSELIEYMAKRLPKVEGGVFIQGESEIASISMCYGAAAAGKRVMTSSSSPGISLKQETISTMACAEVPCVIVNVARSGPGLGDTQPAQADYFQACKGGGHGDYRMIVLTPNSVQECVDLTMLAYELADKYRNPVMILSDAAIGQMMEPVELKEDTLEVPAKPWAATGLRGRKKPNIINSLYIVPGVLEKRNIYLQNKYRTIRNNEVRWEEIETADAELVLVAYGITSRVARNALEQARAQGIKVGLVRPITVWPFPSKPFAHLKESVKAFLAVELSAGQMVEDVMLAVNGKRPTYFFNRMGGGMPTPDDILAEIHNIMNGKGGKFDG